MDIKPIETKYKGYRFRSRLEARWAVFFDTLGVEWEYEKECYQLEDGKAYLPDFWMPTGIGAHGYFVEIKPIEPTEEERNKLQLLAKGTGYISFCFWGRPDNDENWHASVYLPNKSFIIDGCFSIKLHGQQWMSITEQDEVKETIRIKCQHLPFDYVWHTLPEMIQIERLKRGFDAFRSARFEFGEEG